jgi:hypothetical protein
MHFVLSCLRVKSCFSCFRAFVNSSVLFGGIGQKITVELQGCFARYAGSQ